MPTVKLDEDNISKEPALAMLKSLGWSYLSPNQAMKLRGGKATNVILDDVLGNWLREHNRIEHKGAVLLFNDSNIHTAVNALKDTGNEGLIRANEKIYDLLSLGKSLPQIVEGDLKSFTLNYIDWHNPENNVYHVTEEFKVERTASYETRRPDIVLFVNGIPLVVIECKSPAIKDALDQAISQHVRNQKEDEIPRLFHYSQVLMVLSKNEARYATCGTSAKFWALWKEEDRPELLEYAQSGRPGAEGMETNLTEQDRLLFALCRKERLLELTYRFILFDGGEKKIARYQQFFCIKTIMERIRQKDEDGRRKGGVVWHTQGSGKSLTMVMLGKNLALCPDVPDYRIILVSDRVDLDDQIYNTFRACGKEPVQAVSGRNLAKLIRERKASIITTVLNKFDSALNHQKEIYDSPDVFVLVDEGHRAQFGSLHAKLKRTLPHACYIGFSGTPIMKGEKNMIAKFGGLIDSYTIKQAVEDKAVVPLLYEGRHVNQEVDKAGIDAWFEKVTEKLSAEQKEDLKRKFSTSDQLNKTEEKVKAIAWDIGIHYTNFWQGSGFKAQLVTQDKSTALRYKKYLDELGRVSSEVLISGPDDREGETDINADNSNEIIRFWKQMMQRFGTEKEYNRQIINAFKYSDHPEIIIVVDKLLTGFDAPRNTVMYLTRKLKDHTLLQAIARVNRLADDKEYGYILDYYGILEGLNNALELYSKLPEFDETDIEGLLSDIRSEAAKLPEKYSILWDTFKALPQEAEEEDYELHLGDPKLREQFYERLSSYGRTLMIAMSSEDFYASVSPDRISKYQQDYAFFQKLKASVQQRYAEKVKFSDYDKKIQDLLNTYVKASPAIPITSLVNIFDADAFKKEVESLSSDAAKADTIAHRTQLEIKTRMEDDPTYYKLFSELLAKVIRDFREGRIKALEYLAQVTEIMQKVMHRTGDKLPVSLGDNNVAKAYYGVIRTSLEDLELLEIEDILAELALDLDALIEQNRIVDWVSNSDVQNKMKIEMEDCLYDYKQKHGFEITYDHIDEILEKCLEIAKHRRP